jgi:hypothetical protein
MTIRPSGRRPSRLAVLRGRLTFANLTASLALFLALGGTSYAVTQIGSRQIANNSVKSVDVKNNSLTGTDVKNGSLRAVDFAAGQLPAGPKGDTGATGPPGPQGPAGSVRGYAVVGPNGAIATQGGSFQYLVVTRISAGTYCLGQSGGSTGIGNYGPLIATLHGQDGTDGFISANLEFGSACNPLGGHGVHTSDTTGAPADRWFAIMLP